MPQSSVHVPGFSTPTRLAWLQQPCSEEMVPSAPRLLEVVPLTSQCPGVECTGRQDPRDPTVWWRKRPGSGLALQGLRLSRLLCGKLVMYVCPKQHAPGVTQLCALVGKSSAVRVQDSQVAGVCALKTFPLLPSALAKWSLSGEPSERRERSCCHKAAMQRVCLSLHTLCLGSS